MNHELDMQIVRDTFTRAEEKLSQGETPLWHHQYLQVAMKEIERLKAGPQSWPELVAMLDRCSIWLENNRMSHYILTDSGKTNDDGEPVVYILNNLRKPEQFDALQRFVEKSKQNCIAEIMNDEEHSLEG